jgi:cell division cycle protein 37
VHPNVDKKSFIRAKQAQIHQERDHRRHQIKTLKYERIINDGLSVRVDRLLTALKSHKDRQAEGDGKNDDQLVFQAMMESMMDMKIDKDGGSDKPPSPPEGVHEHIKDKPTYPQMMASLVDAVKKDIDEQKSEEPRYTQFIQGLEKEQARIQHLQSQLLAKLAELEKEDKKHITSDDIHEGFSYSSVKNAEEEKKKAAPSSSSSSTVAKKESTVELLNAPKRPEATRTDTGQSSGADADVEEGSVLADDDADNEDDISASPLAQSFAKIKTGDWYACLQFLMKNPEVLAEKETDGLLVEAFNSELDGKPKHARQCVHQGLLLQYCRQLGGRQGVELFFKRIQMKDHQAGKMFNDDVDQTYRRIKVRAAEILKERAENPQGEGVEQIQLHAVDPNTQINISVPPKEATATDPEEKQAEEQARQIFESFPPGLQRALESGKLDEVNKVLAKMSVDEAEEVVEKLGQGGMLSLEEGVIDATTEEGQRVMGEIEKNRKMPEQS